MPENALCNIWSCCYVEIRAIINQFVMSDGNELVWAEPSLSVKQTSHHSWSWCPSRALSPQTSHHSWSWCSSCALSPQTSYFSVVVCSPRTLTSQTSHHVNDCTHYLVTNITSRFVFAPALSYFKRTGWLGLPYRIELGGCVELIV